MTLEDELAKRRELVRQASSAADNRTLEDEIARLQMLQLAETSLQVGDMLPDLALPDVDGTLHRCDELLARAPLVLWFFRGAWCPYCDVALALVERARPAIEAAGGFVVGICPERPELVRQTAIVERGVRFLLLVDQDSAYARLCGLRWETSDANAAMLDRLGVNLPQRQGAEGWALPVPATYIVDAGGIIRFAYANADWTRRASPEHVVAFLESMRQTGS